VPCLGHIINLSVQALLGKDGIQAAAPDDQNDDPDNPDDQNDDPDNPDATANDTNEPDATANVVDQPDATANNLVHPLKRIRKGIVKIRYSTIYCVIYE
jgi:hypothetical protein